MHLLHHYLTVQATAEVGLVRLRRQADPPRSRLIKATEIFDHWIIEAFAYGGHEAISPDIEIAGLQGDLRVWVRGQ